MILTHFDAVAQLVREPGVRRARLVSTLVAVAIGCVGAPSVAVAQRSPAAAPSASASAAPRWATVPTVTRHLSAKDIGLVINTSDPYSVAVGEHYIAARGLSQNQVLRVEIPVVGTLSVPDFRRLEMRIDTFFGPDTQALALAWKTPFAVACNSITSAITLGVDEGLCANSCAPSRMSRYFNSASARPYADLRMRPSMLLAARDPAGAIALIDRGVKSDHSLGLRGALPVNAYYLMTSDKVRSVRAVLFPPAGFVRQVGIDVHVEKADSLDDPKRVVLYETGLTHVEKLGSIDWVAGALADHLTSVGGILDGTGSQMDVLAWIASGATASYGSVSEPCAHPQKFPHPQVLLLHYVQGSTAIEAYWKSVAWPQQGVFVGEPLAAPYSR